MRKSEKNYAAAVKKMQEQDDQEFIAELKDKYGIDEECNSELVEIICHAYGVKDIITLFRDDQLQLQPFNLTYTLTTIPAVPEIDKRHKDKETLKVVTQYEKHFRQWIKLFKYFLPAWFYVTDKMKIGVDWYKYMKLFFKNRPFKTFPSLKSGIEYKDNLGAWKLLAPDELITTYNKHLMKMMDKWGLSNSHLMNTGIGQSRNLVKANTLNRYADTPEELLTPYLVAFRNGTYNFKTNQLQPHNEKDYLLNLHDYSIDLEHPHAPHTDKLLTDMMGDAATFFKEFIGFCFYPNHAVLQDFIILYGQSGEGKSTILNYIKQSLIGPNNFSALDPQTMGDRNNRFATSDLYGKELNVVPDISDKLIQDVNILKGLVGGDSIRAEFKQERSFTFVSRAKNIWSANNLPALRSTDASSALADRANIIKLINGDTRRSDNHFWQHHDMEKVRAERPQFVAECLNLFYQVLQRHRKGLGRSSWSRPVSVQQQTTEWLKHNDPVGEWLESVKEDNPQLFQDGYFLKDQAYTDYKNWCMDDGRKNILTKNHLGNVLYSRYGFYETRVTLPNGKSPRVWANKELKKEWNKVVGNWSKSR